MISEKFILKNLTGLHARPASRFVKAAKAFESEITVIKDAEEVDGKSIMDLLTLGAGQGTSIEIRVDGSDETQAIAELLALLESLDD